MSYFHFSFKSVFCVFIGSCFVSVFGKTQSYRANSDVTKNVKEIKKDAK